MEALDRLYEAMAEDSPVSQLTPFVGSGVSVAATGGNPHASWSGLLLDGIEVCERLIPGLPFGWADQRKGLLVSADMHSFIALAEDIGPRLREIRGQGVRHVDAQDGRRAACHAGGPEVAGGGARTGGARRAAGHDDEL